MRRQAKGYETDDFNEVRWSMMLYFEIQQAKQSNVNFENLALTTVSAEAEALKNFTNPSEVFFFGNISLDVRNNNTKAMNLTVPMNNKNMVLELVEVPESFYNYEVILDLK